MNHRMLFGVATCLAGFSVACSDSGPVETGRAQGVAFDPQTASFSGELSGDVQVSISEDGSNWINLGSLNGITITLQSDTDSSNVHGEQNAPAGSYSHVRLTFDEVVAELLSGSTMGSTTIAQDTTIALGGADGRVEIIKQVSFEVPADGTLRVSINFNLHSADWIAEASLASQLIEDAVIQNNVTVTTRSEPRS